MIEKLAVAFGIIKTTKKTSITNPGINLLSLSLLLIITPYTSHTTKHDTQQEKCTESG